MLVVRVWLPDRPGALGQVASRIGAVHGDVTAIDILERGGGRVIDELVVALPEAVSVELLAKEIDAVDGVSVEHIRPVAEERPDSATAVLQLAAEVAESGARRAPRRCSSAACWSSLTPTGPWRCETARSLHQHGASPDLGWLLAFLAGCGHLDPACPSANEPGDVMWARLPRPAPRSPPAGRCGPCTSASDRGWRCSLGSSTTCCDARLTPCGCARGAARGSTDVVERPDQQTRIKLPTGSSRSQMGSGRAKRAGR